MSMCPVQFIHNHNKRAKQTWLLECCNAVSYRSTNDINTHIPAGRLPQALHVLVTRKPSWWRQERVRTPWRRMASCILLPEMSDRAHRAFRTFQGADKFGRCNVCFERDLPGTERLRRWDPQWAPVQKMSPVKPEKIDSCCIRDIFTDWDNQFTSLRTETISLHLYGLR